MYHYIRSMHHYLCARPLPYETRRHVTQELRQTKARGVE